MNSQKQTLLVRKRDTALFMLAGGKIEGDEIPFETLKREVEEELGTCFAGTAEYMGQFSAPAANERGHIVEAELFHIHMDGPFSLAAEIEETIWVDPADCAHVRLAPLVQKYVLPLAQQIAGR